MTKRAAIPIYDKNPSKIFLSESNRLISMKLGMKHRWLKYYNVYINHDPVMTLTQFMARSSWVKMLFEGKTEPAGNWQMDRILIILKKENGPRASSAPALGVKYIP